MLYKKIVYRFLIVALLVSCSLADSRAQTSPKIDESQIEHLMGENLLRLRDRPEWGASAFRSRNALTHANVPFPCSLPQANSKKMSPEELYQRCSQGVAIIGDYYTTGKDGAMDYNPGATATILSSDGLCLTNYHVLEDFIKVPAQKDDSGSTDSVAYICTIEGQVYPMIRVVAYDKANDIALFRVDTRGRKLNALPLGQPANTGANVHVISHPEQAYYSYSQGMVARNVIERGREQDQSRMEITADYAKGSSGGPILDDYGNVIGMVASTRTIYYSGRTKSNPQMVIKSTIPVSAIKKLIITG